MPEELQETEAVKKAEENLDAKAKGKGKEKEKGNGSDIGKKSSVKGKGKDNSVDVLEMDAEELERSASMEERMEAESLGKLAAGTPRVENSSANDKDPYEAMRKRESCTIM